MGPMAINVDRDKLVSLCKRRGFIFPGSEIYGGLGAFWDYGPLGVELKNNVKAAWRRAMVRERDDIVGLGAAILMHPQVWEAIWESPWWQSLLETMRGEKTSLDLLKWAEGAGKKLAPNLALVVRPEVTLSWIADLHSAFRGVDLDFKNFIGRIAARANGIAAIPCPICGGELSEPATASLMMETFLGPVRASAEKVYLLPQTAQGIFVNFANILTTSRKKLPFGIAQVGKAFRNEITPGNFIFRTREFEQME